MSFAAAYLLGAEGELRLERRLGASAPRSAQPRLAAEALRRGTVVRGSPARDRPVEVAFPLVVGDHRFGVLLVGVSGGAAPQMERLLATVADLTAVSMTSLLRAEHALSEARRDPLTGAGNRRAFHEHLEQMLRVAREEGDAVSIALFDLDGLKAINDRSGHEAGDAVLCQVARRALASVRGSDDVFRVGGDEFAVVVDGDVDVAERIAHRVRRAIRTQRRGPALPTISIGLAGFPDHASTTDGLIARADEAMYAAKRAGKDSIARAGASS